MNHTTLEQEPKFLTSWCGGECDNNCKVCLIIHGEAELINVEGSVFTYKYKKENGND